MVHKPLFEQATKSPQRFKSLWPELLPALQSADYTVGNLEGPIAPQTISGGRSSEDPGFRHDGIVYSGTNFSFNYHPYLLDDLLESGFDMVSTANNHSMDRGSTGATKTIAQLIFKKLNFVGSTLADHSISFLRSVKIRDLKVGFIACTEMLNGIPNTNQQILLCNSNEVLKLIDQSKAVNDATIVMPHWGDEYQNRPSGRQRKLAFQWIDAGATLVVGSHPHVLQTVEWRNPQKKDTGLIIYSLGNFVACQRDIPRRTSVIAHVDLEKSASGLARISGFSYTPVARPQGLYSTKLANPKTMPAEHSHAVSQMGSFKCE